ncbi:hypothetical protein Q5H93_03570 [Hymenobacter sp. ASUV-10]|uniref:Protein phosphatase 2C domain-containing protein n=1 Tax=Hymenobacter aranciens TaxID=3063996 RepID=A0ABT9B6H5_9BACT|nr:hypothetical protein [Hymenobacter sp. ASUV-10]MDO7873798.1 hypothetical protein [Hymenobacter sp. ASUV-10]
MSFKIVESFLMGKHNNSLLCEDAIYYDANFAAVIDGATSKTDFKFDGKSSGRVASELVCEAIKTLDCKSDVISAIELITKKIFDFYKNNKLVGHMKANKADRFSACAAIYSQYRREVWVIGDCQCFVNGEVYKADKKIDNILSEVRALYLKSEIMSGRPIEDLVVDDAGREYILPLLLKQTIFQNASGASEYNYTVFDGFKIDVKNVSVIKVIMSDVVLATDGYPQLQKTLKSSEKYLKTILRKDPLCITSYKATKGRVLGNVSYDDRAFVKIKVV